MLLSQNIDCVCVGNLSPRVCHVRCYMQGVRVCTGIHAQNTRTHAHTSHTRSHTHARTCAHICTFKNMRVRSSWSTCSFYSPSNPFFLKFHVDASCKINIYMCTTLSGAAIRLRRQSVHVTPCVVISCEVESRKAIVGRPTSTLGKLKTQTWNGKCLRSVPMQC